MYDEEIHICNDCYEIFTNFLEVNGHVDIEDYCTSLENNEDSLNCEICKSSSSEYVYSNIGSIIIDVADELSKDISGCEFCEGFDRANFVHAFNKDTDLTSRMDLDDCNGSTVSEYLQEHEQEVPFELVNFFAKLIICPCGYGRESNHRKNNPTGGVFNCYSDIYTESDMNNFYGFEYERFSEFGKKYGEYFSPQELLDFKEHISKYPLLAFNHAVGEAIFNTIKKHFEAGEYKTVLPGTATLYRGRSRKRDVINSYSDADMWSPPPGLSSHGRFNSVGFSILYLSNHIDAIPYEINPLTDEVIDIAEFKLKNEIKIFDIGNFDGEFSGFFEEKNVETKLLKQAYLLPNYIGVCCNYLGYDGVMYEGVHQKSAGKEYSNYALFNINKEDSTLSVNSITAYDLSFHIDLIKNYF
ncbi:RES family NAD+ phosphorylase [Paenibacillus gallinarum]|uniref:RES family NAD+ phosphorylase n=1 Tax=Paenibacillus gallinarum TaxID=2762232 RepID=A0ABR8T3L5_9BACL|nr:RES family NAD+ phosphorylase [Paenibacillus gallinarum]MBD7970346.1 RES family NAD+ phosphorylase [Paenibacillus gallinarum]